MNKLSFRSLCKGGRKSGVVKLLVGVYIRGEGNRGL